MAPRWEWRAYDLVSGAALGSIEMVAWSHTDTLDDSGPFNATLEGRDADIRRDVLAATTVAKSVIVPIRNGVPLGYAGVVWRPDPPTIAGASLLSYLDAQTLDTTKIYAATDQHTLIADLVNWVQSQTGGNAQIDTTQVGTSGVLRDQTWNVWEQKNIGEAIRQKGDNIGGYDFDVRVEYVAGVLTRRLRMWTPRRGRYYVDSQTNVTFELDGTRGNIRSVPAAPRDGLKMVTEVVALGQEVNSTTHERLVARSIRADLLALGWPRLVTTLDLPDIKDLTTLQAHADGHAALYGMAEIDEIVLEVDPDDETWPWGSWDLGDDCLVVIPGASIRTTGPLDEFDLADSDGVAISDGSGGTLGSSMYIVVMLSVAPPVPWFPDGFREVRRIIGHRWTVDGSTERLEVITGRLLNT